MEKRFVSSLLPLFGLLLFAVSIRPAAALNVATDLCTSCTTAAQFQTYAESNIPSGAYFETSTGEKMQIEFFIFNPYDSLASVISAHGPCLSTADGAPCTWHIMWDDLTGTTTEEQSTFSELAPSMVVSLPASVADTFTGTSQEAAVSAWLGTNLASAGPPLDFVTLVVFPDGSEAEYQVTGTDPLTFSLVADSGHAGNGEPENDSGEPVSATTVDVLTSPASFNVLGQIHVTISLEQAADSFDMGTSPGLGSAGVSGGTGELSTAPNLGCADCQASAWGGVAPGEDSGATGFTIAQAAGLTYWDILTGYTPLKTQKGG